MTELPELETAIRHSVATGAYGEASRLLPEYCKQLKAADEIPQAKQLLDWMFRMTSAARAHKVANLKNLAAVSRYLRSGQGSGPDRNQTLRIDG